MDYDNSELNQLLAESPPVETQTPRAPKEREPASHLQVGARPYDPTKSIEKVHYTHKAMIDIIIANPSISQGDIARHFGYTEGWISRVLASDAFNQEMEQRKAEIVDPILVASIEERFRALVYRSIDVVMAKLDAGGGADVALKALELGGKALGFGNKQAPTVNVNSYVALVPAKAVDTADWMTRHGRGEPAIIEQQNAAAPLPVAATKTGT